MSATSSNTSGVNIPSIGSVPARVIPGLINYLQGIVTSLRAVADGDSNPIAADFMEQAGSDNVPDEVMREICRRLVLVVERGNESKLVQSVEAPTDHTKAWQPIDPLTSIPIGQYKIWSDTSNAWVVATPGDENVYTPPKERFVRAVAAPGSSTVNVTFADMLTTDYHVTLTPSTWQPGGSYTFAADTLPDGFGWMITNKSNTQVTIAFYGQPNLGTDEDPLGLTWEVWIRANPTT